MGRLPQLDFLRGVAVILVLFRHHWVGIDALKNVGWVGVDLFFVLSGFLVAGLLFSEKQKFGNVRPFHFLVRRGFKIYPLFYASLLITYISLFLVGFEPLEGVENGTIILAFLAEIFFLQNYLGGIWGHHWSLAVEEHFYLLLALCFPVIVLFMRFAPVVFAACLIMRMWSHDGTHAFETHLRLDSLFMGVCVAYAYSKGWLQGFYSKFRPAVLCILPLPIIFVVNPWESWFTQTAGLSLLSLSFAAWLIVFLYEDVSSIMWKPVLKIGFYSYGIYLFHLYLIRYAVGEQYSHHPTQFTWAVIPSFLIYFFGSIFLGIAMSLMIEVPFLKIRDRWFPRRGAAIPSER